MADHIEYIRKHALSPDVGEPEPDDHSGGYHFIDASVLCYIAIRMLFSPIVELLEVAGSISAGDLTRRVAVRRDDEVGMISHSLNEVSDTLQSHVNNLEVQVQARTDDLQEAFADLGENKNHLQLILDSTAEGIYGIDLHGNCTFCTII